MSGDDERPRRSWREVDRMRDRARSSSSEERRPRGRAAEERARAATQAYLGQLDRSLFAGRAGGSEAERLARAVQDALGTAELGAACRTYLERVGAPREAVLVAAFLDCGERDVVLAALRALAAAVPAGLRVPPALRAQVQGLAEGPDDELAEAAEDVVALL